MSACAKCRAVRRYLQRHSCESLETKPSPRKGMRWGSWQAPCSLHCFVFHYWQTFAHLPLHGLKLERWCYHLNLAKACAPWGQVAENMFYARSKAWLEAFQSRGKFIFSTKRIQHVYINRDFCTLAQYIIIWYSAISITWNIMYSPAVYRYIDHFQSLFQPFKSWFRTFPKDSHEELDLQEQRLKLETRRSLHLRGYLGVATWLQLFQLGRFSTWKLQYVRR